MVLPLLESPSKDTKSVGDKEVLGDYSWLACLIVAHCQAPTQCGYKDYSDSVCPRPLIPSAQGRLCGCTARQFDYLSGWRRGAESKMFQMLIEKDPLSAVRQKWADKFTDSGSTLRSVIITIISIVL